VHTFYVKDDNDILYCINHNADWSGDAHIHPVRRPEERVTLPGYILRACGRRAAFHDAIAALENLE